MPKEVEVPYDITSVSSYGIVVIQKPASGAKQKMKGRSNSEDTEHLILHETSSHS